MGFISSLFQVSQTGIMKAVHWRYWIVGITKLVKWKIYDFNLVNSKTIKSSHLQEQTWKSSEITATNLWGKKLGQWGFLSRNRMASLCRARSTSVRCRRHHFGSNVPAVDDIIKLHFVIGFSNKKMLVILAQSQRIIATSQTLKKWPVTSNILTSVRFMQFSLFF